MQGDISRMMVEIAVSQALKNHSKQSFRRSLRNLVEVGEHYSSGPFQSNFFLVVRQMLRDDNHPYYSLAERAWEQISPKYLEHFSMNLGYESWSRGAALIRSLEEETGCNIPWCLTLQRSRVQGDALPWTLVHALIAQGTEKGIFTYLLFDEVLDTLELQRLCLAFPTCTFVVFTMDSRLDEEALSALDKVFNLMPVAILEGETFTSAPLLRAHKRLYGLCTPYATQEDVARILSGEALHCPGDPDCMLPFFLPRPGCSMEIRQQVGDALLDRKAHPQSSQFPVEMGFDLRRIDQVISTDDCALGLNLDGQFILGEPDAETGLYFPQVSLDEAIRSCLKK